MADIFSKRLDGASAQEVRGLADNYLREKVSDMIHLIESAHSRIKFFNNDSAVRETFVPQYNSQKEKLTQLGIWQKGWDEQFKKAGTEEYSWFNTYSVSGSVSEREVRD